MFRLHYKRSAFCFFATAVFFLIFPSFMSLLFLLRCFVKACSWLHSVILSAGSKANGVKLFSSKNPSKNYILELDGQLIFYINILPFQGKVVSKRWNDKQIYLKISKRVSAREILKQNLFLKYWYQCDFGKKILSGILYLIFCLK